MILGKLWQAFADLTNPPSKQVATVIAKDGDTYTVQYTSGNLADVTGAVDYPVNAKVFVIGDKIDSEAPQMTYFEVEV